MDAPPEQKRAFRGMLMDLEQKLDQADLHRLGFYYHKDYEEHENINGLTFFRDLIREGMLYCNNESLINEFMIALEKSLRYDLIPKVEEYKTRWNNKIFNKLVPVSRSFEQPHQLWVAPQGGKEQDKMVSSSDESGNSMDECQKRMEKVLISGVRKSGSGIEGYNTYGASPRGQKRRKIDAGALDESELSYDSDDNSDDEPPQPHSKHDVQHMKRALGEAKNSPDPDVKVGAVIVDPNTNDVLGVGHNRMPKGCADKFSWSDDVTDSPKLDTKYPYVFHGAKAAIKDALEKSHNLEGTILYTTLFPANTDAQWIVDCGIKEMVYLENTYKKKPFCKAAKRILDTIKYRRMAKDFEDTPAT